MLPGHAAGPGCRGLSGHAAGPGWQAMPHRQAGVADVDPLRITDGLKGRDGASE